MNTRKYLVLSLVVSCMLLATSFGQIAHAVERVGDGQAPVTPPDPPFSFPLPPGQDAPLPDQTPAHVPGRLIVKLRGGTSNKAAATLRAELRATLAQDLPLIGAQIWQIDTMSVEQAVAQYQDHPDVLYVEPDYIVHLPESVAGTAYDLDLSPGATNNVPNDPFFDDLWNMHKINAPLAWDIQTGSADVVVGIIDTGIDYTHPDLAANVWTNPNEIPDNGIDDDANGYVDDVHGWDFADDDNDPMDINGHGTYVAGIIGAVGNNGIDVVGVNWSSSMMALKFIGSNGYGRISDAIAAIEYAVQMGASLTNNNWSYRVYSQALYDAIAAAGESGQLFVATAGSLYHNNKFPSYPKSYDLDNMIVVAATDIDDQPSMNIDHELSSVDLGAPGEVIQSILPIMSDSFDEAYDDGYAGYSGYMAAPHVSGVAALVWSQFPDVGYPEVKHRILASTDPITDLASLTVSGGRLNAYGALTYPGGPIITPHSLNMALQVGERVTRTITIGSFGVDNLNWSINSSASWVQATPVSGTATSDQPATVTLVIDLGNLAYGVYETILTVTPDNPELVATRLPVVAKLYHALLDAPQTMLIMGNDEDTLGRKVALDGDLALVYNAGERIAHILRMNGDGTAWVPSGQVPASGSGVSKLAMAVSDGRILIGDSGTEEAYVYQWDGASWILEATLLPSNTQPSGYFGLSGDIDGDVIAVGAPGPDIVYVYRWNGSDWIQEGELMSDVFSDGFADGDRVAISGNSIIVGDWDVAAAYIYHWDGTDWTQQAKLTAPDGQSGDALGGVVSIHDDVAVVGSADSAYVYRRSGSQWNFEQKLTSDDESVFFGYSIDVTHNLIAIGEPGNRAPDGFHVGAVYVYQWNGSRWGEGKIVARDRPLCTSVSNSFGILGVCDWFGISVAIDEDKMLTGSYAYNQMAGAAFLYDLTDLTVENAPGLGLSAGDLEVYLDQKESAPQTMHIENPGAEPLNWSLAPKDNVGWLDATPTFGTVLPGESQTVEFAFDLDQEIATVLRTSLIILSDAPFEQRVEFPIALHLNWNYATYLPLIVR